ncbi:MAG: CoA pyrophosphatase [Halocynthiibacter sp.]
MSGAHWITTLERATFAGGGSSDFDLNPGNARPDVALRDAAVLVGVIMRDEPMIVLTKRASHLKHHPGQVAFPGGKMDEGDPSLHDTALREAHEEIGLPPENVTVLGVLPPHQTVTQFQVTPVLAHIHTDFVPSPEVGEVEEMFEVPLAHVLNPDAYLVQSRIWMRERRYYYTLPYGPYYIWGATARMLRVLCDRVQP